MKYLASVFCGIQTHNFIEDKYLLVFSFSSNQLYYLFVIYNISEMILFVKKKSPSLFPTMVGLWPNLQGFLSRHVSQSNRLFSHSFPPFFTIIRMVMPIQYTSIQGPVLIIGKTCWARKEPSTNNTIPRTNRIVCQPD